jgi:lipoprotein-releasing system permease protein
MRKLAFQIAFRYLFGKKTTNAINIITGISVSGITIGTCALILVLSVFNGFHDVLFETFGSFHPDIKVIPSEGKFFKPPEDKIKQIKSLSQVNHLALVLEEKALFSYDNKQYFGTIKGVDQEFIHVTRVDSSLSQGQYTISNGGLETVVGSGIAANLEINIEDQFTSMEAYLPKRKGRLPGSNPFNKRLLYPVGVFSLQQDFDNEYIISDIEVVRKLLNTKNDISSLEISLENLDNLTEVKSKIAYIMGDNFEVLDRFEIDQGFFKLMNVEKLMAFGILSFILLLVAFNMIGALWMIIIEKKSDIAVLQSFGATDFSIKRIFLYLGLLITGLGLVIGLIIAALIYWLQTSYGIVPLAEGFIIDSYPIKMKMLDVFGVSGVVGFIGWLASQLPMNRAVKVKAAIRKD